MHYNLWLKESWFHYMFSKTEAPFSGDKVWVKSQFIGTRLMAIVIPNTIPATWSEPSCKFISIPVEPFEYAVSTNKEIVNEGLCQQEEHLSAADCMERLIQGPWKLTLMDTLRFFSIFQAEDQVIFLAADERTFKWNEYRNPRISTFKESLKDHSHLLILAWNCSCSDICRNNFLEVGGSIKTTVYDA